jgi:hypothetical protein
MIKMIEYGDLSKDAKQVLKLTMVYPHLTPNLKAAMRLSDPLGTDDMFFKNGLTELENAGLINLNSTGASDKIVTPLAYEIVPKEVLVLSLEEARKALKNITEEATFTQRGRTIY